MRNPFGHNDPRVHRGGFGLILEWLRGTWAPFLFLFTLVAVAATFFIPGPRCNSVFCSIGTGLIGGGVVGAYGYFLFASATDRAVRRLRVRLRALAPEVPVATGREHSGRRTLIERLAVDVRREVREAASPAPKLVVGEIGSGKSIVLRAVQRALLEEVVERSPVRRQRRHDRRVPLPVFASARGQPPDVRNIVRDAFLKLAEGLLRPRDDATQIWRELCRRQVVVAFVEDLDEVAGSSEARRTSVLEALEAASGLGFPFIASIRPEAVPREWTGWVFDLKDSRWNLSPEDAMTVALGADRRTDTRWHGDSLVRNGRLWEMPYYLELLAELKSVPSVEGAQPGANAVRLAILDRFWEERLEEHGGGTKRSGAVLARLARVAYAAVRLGPGAVPVDELEQELRRLDRDASGEGAPARWLIEEAEKLKLTERRGGEASFLHPISQAYFAARLVREDAALARPLLDQPPSPELRLALAFASVGDPGGGMAHELCEKLLRESDALGNDLPLVVEAAETVSAADLHSLDGRIAAAAAAARAGAPLAAKEAAVAALAQLHDDAGWDALWEYTDDDAYSVRWRAAVALADGGSGAYLALRGRIGRVLANAKTLADEPTLDRSNLDDWSPEVRPLKMLGWALPALRTGLRQEDRRDLADEAERYLEDLVVLCDVTEQRGLESSIAQGLKADAMQRPGEAVDPQARRLLAKAGFWYSRLVLVHAIALRCAGANGGADHDLDALRAIGSASGEHPFVREVVRLSLIAAEGSPSDASRWIWRDEGEAVGRGFHELSPESNRLVGDIALVLNLNEQGEPPQRLEFGTRNDLPFCLSASPDRSEIVGGGCRSQECTFKLCPYRDMLGQPSARRELSRAFCAYQHQHAAGNAVPWHPRFSAEARERFWAEMDRRASG